MCVAQKQLRHSSINTTIKYLYDLLGYEKGHNKKALVVLEGRGRGNVDVFLEKGNPKVVVLRVRHTDTG